MKIPRAQVYKFFFLKPDWHSDDLGLRNTVIQNASLRKCATVITEYVNSTKCLCPVRQVAADTWFVKGRARD